MKLKAKGDVAVVMLIDCKSKLEEWLIVSHHQDPSDALEAAANLLLSGKTKKAQIVQTITLTLTGKK